MSLQKYTVLLTSALVATTVFTSCASKDKILIEDTPNPPALEGVEIEEEIEAPEIQTGTILEGVPVFHSTPGGIV